VTFVTRSPSELSDSRSETLGVGALGGRQRVRKILASLVLVLSLACGGGSGDRSASSGDSGAPPSGPPPPALPAVRGAIQVAFGTAADSDVNEPTTPFVSNDTPASAQELPNPVTLGGYVNTPSSGTAGRSFATGDLRDLYRVSLAAGEAVRLLQADGAGDLDLALLETDGAELLSSDSDAGFESLTVPATGEYLVEVSAFSGASNYVLSIGQQAGSQPARVAAPSQLVPGEMIVRFRDDSPARLTPANAVSRAQGLGLSVRRHGGRGETLLAVSDDQQVERAFRTLGLEHLGRRPAGLGSRARMRAATRRLAKALRQRADVESADPNWIRHPTALPSDELYPLQWHYDLIGLPQAWDNVEPDSGVVVAVIDTGIVPDHPDFEGQLVGGYDFISSAVTSQDGNGCDADPTDPGDGLSLGSSSWHGTHVAGTIAARTSLQPGGDALGVAGVAWNARVMPLRALGFGGGSDFDVIQALLFAAGLENACGVLPPRRADVVNLSLGGPEPSGVLQATLAQVRNAGVVVVAAAGNDGGSVPFYPAAYDEAIGVAAVDASKRLAPYSNFGDWLDLAAPGGHLGTDLAGDGFGDGVLSTFFDSGSREAPFVYAFSEGTSMAAPHVAGVVALMLGVNGSLTPGDVDSLLSQGRLSEEVGSSFLFGKGLVDAAAAVRAAFESVGGEPPVDAPRLRADPPALNFGAVVDSFAIELDNAGGSDRPLEVESLSVLTSDGAAWLRVVAEAVDAEGLGTYRVTVDRNAVAAGIYSGTLRFTSSENTVEVAVLMQVGTFAAGAPDAGRHFVLLLDPDTLSARASVPVDASGGVYRFQIEGVEPGEYLLVAGTDLDNDFVICDAGEACGAFPTLDQPQRISVAAGQGSLDFSTSFALRLSGASAAAPTAGHSRVPERRLFHH